MNDEALETYLNIIKTHSLTKTAENMFISQSAVSNRLISLEKELNVKLIDRSPGQKGVVLTQKGEEFVEFAEKASGTEPSDSGLEPGRCDGGVTGSVCYQPHRLCERVLQGTSWERKTLDHISDTLDRPHYFDVGEQGDRHRNYPACLLFEGGGGCADL